MFASRVQNINFFVNTMLKYLQNRPILYFIVNFYRDSSAIIAEKLNNLFNFATEKQERKC